MIAIDPDPKPSTRVDAMVIGRNEGAQLEACIASLLPQVTRVIYVDSGSTDGSVDLATGMGAVVVPLYMAQPFTKARARNAGLMQVQAEFVQFADGDCEVWPDWVAGAVAFDDAQGGTVVCGRRREKIASASVYNRLCDAEWDSPIGPARASGGDALMRMADVRALGGFRDRLAAAEEAELCLGLARAGGSIWRMEAEMTLHDAAITRFGQ